MIACCLARLIFLIHGHKVVGWEQFDMDFISSNRVDCKVWDEQESFFLNLTNKSWRASLSFRCQHISSLSS